MARFGVTKGVSITEVGVARPRDYRCVVVGPHAQVLPGHGRQQCQTAAQAGLLRTAT